MEKRMYTVISTSGWKGDGWNYRGTFDTRKEAMDHAKDIHQPDAKFDGYITGVIGGTKICRDHEFCYTGDTSRLSVDPDLRSRRAHISELNQY